MDESVVGLQGSRGKTLLGWGREATITFYETSHWFLGCFSYITDNLCQNVSLTCSDEQHSGHRARGRSLTCLTLHIISEGLYMSFLQWACWSGACRKIVSALLHSSVVPPPPCRVVSEQTSLQSKTATFYKVEKLPYLCPWLCNTRWGTQNTCNTTHRFSDVLAPSLSAQDGSGRRKNN